MESQLESWRRVWRDGIAPVLSLAGLSALRNALAADDPRLTQGSTTTPPPLMAVQDWPVEAACAVAFSCWRGESLVKVIDVEEAFAKALFDADVLLSEPAGTRHFLNWFDDTPRPEMIRQLLPEVDREIVRRKSEPQPAAA